VLYTVLLLVFVSALRRSRSEAKAAAALCPERSFVFSWREFVLACAVATVVTTVSRLVFFRFAPFQILLMFSFYVVAGLLLFAGAVTYAVNTARGQLTGKSEI
jgi:hypothetical protein